MMLAGEKEAYSTGDSCDMNIEERKADKPSYCNQASLVFYSARDRYEFEAVQEIGVVRHFTGSDLAKFSTAMVHNIALPTDLLEYAAQAFLEVHADILRYVSEDNKIHDDFNRIMGLLRVDPVEFNQMDYESKSEVSKKFSDIFLKYIAKGEPPQGLEAAFGHLRGWVDSIFRGQTNSPIKNVTDVDFLKGVFSKEIQINQNSDFQSKLIAQIQSSTDQSIASASTVAAVMDSLMESLAERSGLDRGWIDIRYEIEVKKYPVANLKL